MCDEVKKDKEDVEDVLPVEEEDPAFPDEEEEEVTMEEVLREVTQREEETVAVLGGSDENKCSYDEGYVKRQALYACKTCADEIGVSTAGVCLACSIKCHDGHDCYELYTKRNFRCDCGNNKFAGKKCLLIPEKEEDNPGNSYNQNFEGKYCICSRPYPDPEDDNDDQMIQCIVCEDWFHGRHLGNPVPEDFGEMICGTCMESHKFLRLYHDNSPESNSNKRPASDVADEEPASKKLKGEGRPVQQEASRSEIPVVQTQQNQDSSQTRCHLKELEAKKDPSGLTGACFFDDDWRSKLCLCQDCKDLYKKEHVSFLTDLTETTHYYEEEGKRRVREVSPCSSTSSMERGMEAFGQMPRTQQVEMLHGFNSMQAALKEYLQKFADENKVVTKKDIEEFFDHFKRNQRKDGDSNPLAYSCGR